MGHLQHAVPAGAQELLQLVFGIKAQAGNLADHVGLSMGAPVAKASVPSVSLMIIKSYLSIFAWHVAKPSFS